MYSLLLYRVRMKILNKNNCWFISTDTELFQSFFLKKAIPIKTFSRNNKTSYSLLYSFYF